MTFLAFTSKHSLVWAALMQPGRSLLNRPTRIARLFVLITLLSGSACNDPVEPGKGQVHERWFKPQAEGFPRSRPVVSGNSVYFADGGGSVIARDLSTGDVLWSTSVGSSPHTISDKIGGENFVLAAGVIVAAAQFHVSGLDAENGTELWRYHPPLDSISEVQARPGYVEKIRMATDGRTVFIPARGVTVSAVDLASGIAKWVWRVQQPDYPSGSFGVIISGDTVFATVWHFLNKTGTVSEAWLVALDRETGGELWRVILPRQSSGTMINCAPAIWNNLVIVTLTSGELFAVDRRTRGIAWVIPPKVAANGLGSALIIGAEIRDDVVYANGSDQKLHAYRATDGTQIWESEGEQFGDDLLVTDKFVYASGSSLFIVDRRTGVRYGAPGHPRGSVNYAYTSPAGAHNGQIFVTFSNGAWSFDEP